MNRRDDFDPRKQRRPKPVRRFFALLLMLIGAATVVVMLARYAVVPLLVYLEGVL